MILAAVNVAEVNLSRAIDCQLCARTGAIREWQSYDKAAAITERSRGSWRVNQKQMDRLIE